MNSIRYKSVVPVRFSDLDSYGHVNSTHYLDYVISSRWAFARDQLRVSDRSLIERKIGFYLSKAQMAFKRPIVGAGAIVASSHVQEIIEARLIVPWEIRSTDEATLHADGVLEFAVIDLSTNKPTSCPDWVRALFFGEEAPL
jgi:YbgC/YbaW family acyl-CoA thioester hydrolase